MVVRTQEELEDVIADADGAMDGASRFPGMTYEEGVAAALRWAIGDTDEPPLEE